VTSKAAKAPVRGSDPGARLKRTKLAVAPLRAWRSGVLAIVVWAGATSLVLISDYGYLDLIPARSSANFPVVSRLSFPELCMEGCQPREFVDRNPLLDKASNTYVYKVFFPS
jgi:hypothetical protein